MSGQIHKVSGAREEKSGTKTVGGGKTDKGVTILDKNAKTTPPPIEITEGEGDRNE